MNDFQIHLVKFPAGDISLKTVLIVHKEMVPAGVMGIVCGQMEDALTKVCSPYSL